MAIFESLDKLHDICLEKQAFGGDDGNMVASRPDALTKFRAIQKRRELSKPELDLIDQESGKIIPKVFTSGGDPIAVDLSSPMWAGVGGAALGAAPALAAGHFLKGDAGKYTTLGAIPLALLAGTIAYHMKKATNRDLVDYIARMPAGSTRRDIENNPEWQVENDFNKLINTAKMTAASRGIYKNRSFLTPEEEIDIRQSSRKGGDDE